jgi:hypothetical protein
LGGAGGWSVGGWVVVAGASDHKIRMSALASRLPGSPALLLDGLLDYALSHDEAQGLLEGRTVDAGVELGITSVAVGG